MKITATLLTAIAFFAIGYAAGKAKKEKEHPLDKKAIPVIREVKILFV